MLLKILSLFNKALRIDSRMFRISILAYYAILESMKAWQFVCEDSAYSVVVFLKV
jgi:hypothetical protein